jgi:hypothetical protein
VTREERGEREAGELIKLIKNMLDGILGISHVSPLSLSSQSGHTQKYKNMILTYVYDFDICRSLVFTY